MKMKDKYGEFLGAAIRAAEEAGGIARSMQHALRDIRFKGEKDVVTEADFACDAAIRKSLAAAYPGHNIVTEEDAAVEQGSEYTWYVDPIDGTVNYSRGFPLWGVSIGLRKGEAMVAGCIWLPALEEMFTVTLGGGAYLNGKRIQVSAVEEMHAAIISHGDFNVGNTDAQRKELNERNLQSRGRAAAALQRVKCLGSAVVEGSFVAAGRMEAYCMLAMKPWDVAVGSLLVTEAGGNVTHLDGGKFSIDGHDALFSNGILHDPILKVLQLG
ncbi:MAG TPA: inositol monophosphatase family protein [Fibrobacteria bacterium]|nr:inositol monophosphatase family protein [Fibrobacteria bacterium]